MKMKYFTNTIISKLDFQLFKKGDIIEFEGPLLSHFSDEMGEDYFMKWVDKDSECNRWLLFNISKIDLNDYFQNSKTLRNLIKSSNEIVYLIDIDDNINYKKIQVLSKDSIPENYLPTDKSIFNEKISTQYAKVLKKEIVESFSSIDTKSIKNKLKQVERHIDDVNFMNTLDKRRISTSVLEVAMLKATEKPIRILMDYYQDIAFTEVVHLQPAAYVNQMNYLSYFITLNRTLNKISITSNRKPNNKKLVKSRNKIVKNAFETLINNTCIVVHTNPEKYSKDFEIWKEEVGKIDEIEEFIK